MDALSWIFGAAALTIVVTLATGCSSPYRHADLRPPTTAFEGIDDAFKAADGTVVPEVDVLLFHGMGTTLPSWVRDKVKALASALSFPWSGVLPPFEQLANGAQLYQISLGEAGRQLKIAAVLWSPITMPAKATLCYDVTEPTPVCTDRNVFSKDKRASLNTYLKSQIMDDRLSDVTFYLNATGGAAIRGGVEDALLRSLSTNAVSLDQLNAGVTPTAKDVPLFVISESLGSKIVVDSLKELEMNSKAPEFARDVRSGVRALYLLANQIPILNLGEADPYQHLRDFAVARTSQRQARGREERPLQVVAFSDPNDLFSYQLPANALQIRDAAISNVVVSNDCTYLGIYENLDTAHTGYVATTPVAQAIAHGSAVLGLSTARFCASGVH